MVIDTKQHLSCKPKNLHLNYYNQNLILNPNIFI